MKLNIRVSYLKALKKQGGTEITDFTYRGDEVIGTVDSNRFVKDDLTKLRVIAQEGFDKRKEEGSLGLVRKLDAWFKLQENPDTVKISNLDALVEAIRLYMVKTPHKWFFTQESDGEMVPYYTVGATYNPPDPERLSPATTVLELAAMCRGAKETKNFTFHRSDLGVPLSVVLERSGLYRETEEMVATYEKECIRYREIADKTGEQFLARGRAFNTEGYYTHSLVEMEVDGVLTRVVMDELGDPDSGERRGSKRGKSDEAVADARFWKEGQQKSHLDEEESDKDITVLPLQPYVQVFDLIKHRFVTMHVNSLDHYVYDETMVDKLILPESDKDLIHILVQGADAQMEDIVKGKTGGIIVIATGPPGTGKTLTSEIFSECVKRPLYSVKCTQLGLSPDDLEKKLTEVLGRAARWKAILLIDEADVYVHERGNDIVQNAIVGVWLRTLEYYNGIMFMTSNRSTIIDDAIMSRATAWIRYDYPVPVALRRIWLVLSKQFNVTLSLETVEKLVNSDRLGHISGRTVKNLLKLARLLSLRKKKPITVDMIEYVSQYLDTETKATHALNKDAGRQNDAGGRQLKSAASATNASPPGVAGDMETVSTNG